MTPEHITPGSDYYVNRVGEGADWWMHPSRVTVIHPGRWQIRGYRSSQYQEVTTHDGNRIAVAGHWRIEPDGPYVLTRDYNTRTMKLVPVANIVGLWEDTAPEADQRRNAVWEARAATRDRVNQVTSQLATRLHAHGYSSVATRLAADGQTVIFTVSVEDLENLTRAALGPSTSTVTGTR